jgi:hypothetical protein
LAQFELAQSQMAQSLAAPKIIFKKGSNRFEPNKLAFQTLSNPKKRFVAEKGLHIFS